MRSARVLLVERDRNTRELLRLWLQLDGQLIAEADDETEALAIIAQEPPDLVLLDLSSDRSCWVTFFIELNELPSRELIRVIGTTSDRSTSLAVDAIRLGASDVLAKPIRQDDLRLSVASVLSELSHEKCAERVSHHSS